MTKEKALIMTLKIIDTCKTYGNQDKCNQCPFNFNGCILIGGEIPAEWELAELTSIIGRGRNGN